MRSESFDDVIRIAHSVRPVLEVSVSGIFRTGKVFEPYVVVTVQPFEVAACEDQYAISISTDLIVDTSSTINVEGVLAHVSPDFWESRWSSSARSESHPTTVFSSVQELRKAFDPFGLSGEALAVLAPFQPNMLDREASLPFLDHPRAERRAFPCGSSVLLEPRLPSIGRLAHVADDTISA
jgi:hypothetical protein